MLATIASATLLGVVGTAVTVEVHVSSGLPGFTIVGLPDASCREARDRVRGRAAVEPAALAPAAGHGQPGADRCAQDRCRPRPRIAVGLLVADGQIPGGAADGVGFVGELGLDGSIRPVAGALPLVDALDTETVVVAPGSAVEAQLVGRHVVRSVATLAELLASLCGDEPWPPLPSPDDLPPLPEPPDLADVRGQPLARRALEVAAAGGHHLLMTGAPGSGKTMLAQRLVGILPDLDLPDALETTRVHSAVGVALPPGGLVRRPPFRAPHHGASAVAMIGGGGSDSSPARSRSPPEACKSSSSVACRHGTKTSTTATAAVYCRITRDVEDTGLGWLVRKRNAAPWLSGLAGTWRPFSSTTTSAPTRGAGGRPTSELRAMVAAREVEAVVAWAPDRLTRHTRELQDLIDLVESTGVDLATVTAGAVDLSTPAGRMQARIVGSVARYESEHKSARLRSKHRELAEAGAVAGGGCRPSATPTTAPPSSRPRLHSSAKPPAVCSTARPSERSAGTGPQGGSPRPPLLPGGRSR